MDVWPSKPSDTARPARQNHHPPHRGRIELQESAGWPCRSRDRALAWRVGHEEPSARRRCRHVARQPDHTPARQGIGPSRLPCWAAARTPAGGSAPDPPEHGAGRQGLLLLDDPFRSAGPRHHSSDPEPSNQQGHCGRRDPGRERSIGLDGAVYKGRNVLEPQSARLKQ